MITVNEHYRINSGKNGYAVDFREDPEDQTKNAWKYVAGFATLQSAIDGIIEHETSRRLADEKVSLQAALEVHETVKDEIESLTK